MILRRWQAQCHDAAVQHFLSGHLQFGCAATPGGGKTVLAACIGKSLFQRHAIDFVLCLVPSNTTKAGMKSTFEKVLAQPVDGLFGATGDVMTYQRFASVSPSYLKRLSAYRLLIVTDEIHHCGGWAESHATSWAKPLLKLQALAKTCYVLSLSGTPWRTDKLPVTTLAYDDALRPSMHYQYSLRQAISDGVCRTPIITTIDNQQWLTVDVNHEMKSFKSLTELLQQRTIQYQHVLSDDDFLAYVLKRAHTALTQRRRHNQDAGGLIVASSIEHARQIMNVLNTISREQATLVTSDAPDSLERIHTFSQSNHQWIIAVGMISEGTDIPRLQVCCYLSRICTELHYRQVLGRIIRRRSVLDAKDCDLFMPAHPELMEFVFQLRLEIPEVSVSVDKKRKSSQTSTLPPVVTTPSSTQTVSTTTNNGALSLSTTGFDGRSSPNSPADREILPTLTAYGRFKQEVLSYSL